ncbi:MAG: M15 family metallopeptidase [Bacteroidales bacterium]|nr:M15 family metallopeptidase [Candidatus Scybalousia scybalohippi]
MRNLAQLHPVLQMKAVELQELCKHNGIAIKYSECLRTAAEQDALYAKGRTAKGSIVTNAKGSSYSSMHQWGVAIDFYLDMDIDRDGSKIDDAYNNSTHLFEKVGKLAQSLGLEWGGSWKTIKDLPHVQLADWGSTPAQLKKTYGTPDRFFKTWTDATQKQTVIDDKPSTASKNVYDAAQVFDKKLAGNYIVSAKSGLNLRQGTNKGVITCMPKNSKVKCYGYCTGDYLLVEYGKYTGYAHKDYLKK